MQAQDHLVQGTPEWHAYRRTHFNASDAPAMMGCSPYKTRSQLIKELATGLGEEVTPEMQRRFDDGHRFEALARPLAEQIVGEDLYPLVGSEGVLSASFDGLTMAWDTAFEHKSLNDELRSAFADIATIAPEYRDQQAGKLLPLVYRVQMQQQIMVSGCARVLFMASKWQFRDGNWECVEVHHCWFYPDDELGEQIAAGWKQLEADVAAYVPDAAPVALVAAPVQALPSVAVKVEGALKVSSNLDKFEVALRDFLEHRLIREPKTDQDFADLDVQIKAMKGAEAALASTDSSMLAQIEPVDTALKHSAMLAKLVKDNRLMAEKLLASEKERRRTEIVSSGVTSLRDHVAALNERLGKPYMPTIAADFAGAIKGMRSLKSMEDAVATLLANSKIQANAAADRIDANLKMLRELAAKHAFLFADTSTIVHKAPEDLTALVKLRIADHEAAEAKRLEEERERIRKEEAERAEREAREDHERRRRAVAAIRFPAPQPEPAPISSLVAANNAARAAIAEQTERTASIRVPQPASEPPPPMPKPKAADISEPATLKLGEICARLGITMTAAFVADTLGIAHSATDKAAKLYRESDFPKICRALAAHAERCALAEPAEA